MGLSPRHVAWEEQCEGVSLSPAKTWGKNTKEYGNQAGAPCFEAACEMCAASLGTEVVGVRRVCDFS